ncbi:hypothetical protein JTB14_008429 [Gonioctena quinquepunctata]|nr:hypothetical protein JTB14_008429 [Gonioctena quinquepunctata]
MVTCLLFCSLLIKIEYKKEIIKRIILTLREGFKRTRSDVDYHRHREFFNMVPDKIEYNPNRFYKHIRSSMSSKLGTPQFRQNNDSITNNNQEVHTFLPTASGKHSHGTSPTMNHQTRNYESLTNIKFTPELMNLKPRCLDTNEFSGPDELTPTFLKE